MTDSDPADASSGIPGLDDVLRGGFARRRLFLIEGDPGAGKTTVALQFLLAGVAAGERVLYITLSESEAELRASALSHGWSLGGVEVFELVSPDSLLDEDQQQSLLYSSDLELGETTRRILEAVARARPQRIVLDSLSELLLLAQSPLRFRRQLLAIKHALAAVGATVLVLDDLTSGLADRTLHSLAHGVLRLEEIAPSYGAGRRRAHVIKYRGRQVRGGFHDLVIATGGLQVFPRLVSAEHRASPRREAVSSGTPGLDSLLGGGLDRGASVLVLGPAGAGKSLLTLSVAAAAVARGERAALFVFDEEIGLLRDRALGIGIDVAALEAGGGLMLAGVDAAELSPGEFAHRVRACVEEGARVVGLDSLNGYQSAMPEEQALILHLHELIQYMNRQGVASLVTVAQHGLVGDMLAPVDVTYLADTVLLMRYFEARGRVRRAMSVLKKRMGPHEDTIREFRIGAGGFRLGEPLTQFQGVLRGVPDFAGDPPELLAEGSA